MMGRPASAALRIMIDYHGLDATVEGLALETDEIFATLLDSRLAQMPGLAELLDALERVPLPKAIATSSGPAFAQTVLAKFGLGPRFAFVLTCDDVHDGKPHPEIYLLAADRLKLPPADLLVLEDSANGCRAALAAGARVVAVPGGHSRRHDFTGAAFVAESLADPRLYELLRLS
jgi:HAD superfamily hydrolase (TIGR01509 family)